jgi:phosphoglycolate phosphatase
MVNNAVRKVDGLLFDKDGTLIDFHGTWDPWAAEIIAELAGSEPGLMAQIAGVIDYDLEKGRLLPTSIAIAETNREISEAIAAVLPGRDVDEVEQFLVISGAKAPVVPVVPLRPFLEGLAKVGISLGVLTNDSEFGARAHLKALGIEAHFDFIAGFDSGFGAKPAPDPLLHYARAHGLAPGRVAMVGDSVHDLMAGRAAGMITIGVLTGPAAEHHLAPHVDVIFPDIGHIPGWLMA